MSQLHDGVHWLKPGQVAERAGVAVSTLHHYESVGLIRSRRTPGNRREYRRDTLRVLAFIRASQRVGISLERIRAALDELPQEGLPTNSPIASSTSRRCAIRSRTASAAAACRSSRARTRTPTTSSV